MIKDTISLLESKRNNKKYPLAKVKLINEDFLDDLSYDNDDEETLKQKADDELSSVIRKSVKYNEFIRDFNKIVDKALSEIDNFPIKLYKSTSILGSKSATSLTYDDVVKDLESSKGSDLGEYLTISSRNGEKRAAEKEAVINAYSSGDIRADRPIGKTPSSSMREIAGVPKYAKRDPIVDTAERLVVLKHIAEQLENKEIDDSESELAKQASIYCLSSTLISILLYFKFRTSLIFSEYNKIFEASPSYTSMDRKGDVGSAAMALFGYLHHNCRQVPDLHTSPLILPDTIPLYDTPNSRSSEKSLKRFLHEITYYENCVTKFDPKLFDYEYSMANNRVKANVIENLKDDNGKIIEKRLPFGTKLEDISNIDLHSKFNITSSDEDKDRFNVSPDSIKNWFYELFSKKLDSICHYIGSDRGQRITKIATMPAAFGILSNRIVEDFTTTMYTRKDNETEIAFRTECQRIFTTYFQDLISKNVGLWGGAQSHDNLGSLRFFETIIFDSYKKTDDPRSLFKTMMKDNVPEIFTENHTWYAKQLANFAKSSGSPTPAQADFELNIKMLKAISKTKKASTLNDYQKALIDSDSAVMTSDLNNYLLLIRPDLLETTIRTPFYLQSTLDKVSPQLDKEYREKYLNDVSKYKYPIIASQLSQIISPSTRVSITIKSLFAESFDELLNASKKYSLYDSTNKIFDYEYKDVLDNRAQFAASLAEDVFKSFTNTINSLELTDVISSKIKNNFYTIVSSSLESNWMNGPEEMVSSDGSY